MTFLEQGQAEKIKGAWHLGGLIFAAGATLYNLGALIQRRERHLLVNAAVYGALTLYETAKCRHHFEPPGLRGRATTNQ